MAEEDTRMEFAQTPDPERKTFEEQLRDVLRRVDAPAGFADRVSARAAQREFHVARTGSSTARKPPLLHHFRQPLWRMLYAAAAVLAITTGVVHVERVRSEQRRSNQAAAQFDAALQVTHHALDHISVELETTEFGQVQRALENDGGAR